jgi:hypothetical protein
MHEMIERVARAIAAEISEHADLSKISYELAAAAAIRSMRDPTKDMEAAGDDLDDWGVPSNPGSGNASALAHWTAMIDAVVPPPENK